MVGRELSLLYAYESNSPQVALSWYRVRKHYEVSLALLLAGQIADSCPDMEAVHLFLQWRSAAILADIIKHELIRIAGRGFPLLYDVFLIYRNSSTMEREI